ncbi:MAG: hypothetical protein QG599_924 [Pseudomonadota bacterium]|nr:hypothetical protein [Pseudomonadota bacterium]
MIEQTPTQHLTWREIVLTAALTGVGVSSLVAIEQSCTFNQFIGSLMPFTMSALADDPVALSAYCASPPRYVLVGPLSSLITHNALCSRLVCPLDTPPASQAATPGAFVNPVPAPTPGRLWRISAKQPEFKNAAAYVDRP